MRARPLSVRHLFLLVPVLAVAVASVRPIRDNSFLWHVEAGRMQLEAGEVLRTDPFSYTMPEEPWRTQSWLAELVYGLGDRSTGDLAWAPILTAVLGVAALGIAGTAVYRRTRRRTVAAVVMAGLAWLAIPYLVPRPVVFSFVFFALMPLVLERRARWVLPLLVWVWAGVHGSFVVGIGVAVLEAIRRRDRELAGVAALSVVAASLTAHGLGVWQILLQFAGSRSALSTITEWAPPNLLAIPALPFVGLIGALLLGAARGRIKPVDLVVVVPVLVFGLASLRSLYPAALLLAPWAALAWPERAEQRSRREIPVLNFGLAVVLVVAAGLWMTARLTSVPDPDHFPVAAVAALEDGPVFHDDRTGGYLMYAAPDRKVFVDDRAEFYGNDFYADFIDARAGREAWRRLFDGYDIHQALLPVDAALTRVLETSGWHVVYEDDHYEVLQG